MKTQADIALLMEAVFKECSATRDAGQKEYAHDESNALRNFEQTGKEMEVSREKVLYIFAKKHWDGITAWIIGHRSQRENVRGRIKDLIVYLVLLWAMIDDGENTPTVLDQALVCSRCGGVGGKHQNNCALAGPG